MAPPATRRPTACWRMLYLHFYPGSIYGERMPIGKMEVVENFKPTKTLRVFYRRWHRPDNEAIIIVGDINPDTIEARIVSLFSQIKAPKAPVKTTALTVPVKRQSYSVMPDRPRTACTRTVQLHFRHDTPDYTSESDEIRAALVSDPMLNMLVNRFDELESEPDCAFHHYGSRRPQVSDVASGPFTHDSRSVSGRTRGREPLPHGTGR